MKYIWFPGVLMLSLFLMAACKNSAVSNATVQDDTSHRTLSAPALPPWALQSNIYEVNVRQYTREGTFNAFAASLPRLKEMGVEILWFMPITPISKVDRKGVLGSYYAVQDYKAINPEFGNMADWKSLVQKAHQMGFKVITDWVANHSGADNGWITRHPDFYTKDSTGKIIPAFDWTDTRDLNYDNRELRDSMIDAMKFWLTQSDIDGFRCDVAGEVPADFWKECIPALRNIKTIFMLAEGDKGELHDAGFNATYPWAMHQTMKKIAAGERNCLSIDSVLRSQDNTFPAGAIRMYFTSNHDENSWSKSDYGTFPGPKHAPFAVFTQTMRNSLPLIYSGQEEPILDSVSFFYKDAMKMGKYARAPFYAKLLQLRKSSPALATDASFRRVTAGDSTAVYAYAREKNGSKVLVILNLSPKEQIIRLGDESLSGEAMNVFTGNKEKINTTGSYHLGPWGYLLYNYAIPK